ncbi:MAG: PilW family protein [Acidobacteriota bacterium]
MSRRSDRPDRGFTLIEVMVALLSLVLILVLSAQLLFATRRAAVRQQLQVEARQVGRGAVDYVTYEMRGATDLSGDSVPRDPLALITWMWQGNLPHGTTTVPVCGIVGNHDAGCTQRTYNNVADATLADVGTDIITIARTDANARVVPINWGGGAFEPSNLYWRFDMGCPPTSATTWGTNDAGNYALFKQYTGCCDANGWSQPLVLVDGSGQAMLYQITDYKDTDNADTCTNIDNQCISGAPGVPPDVPTGPCMHVVSNPGGSAVNLPGGQRNLTWPIHMNAGVRFISFRVCQGWLEQRAGMFDATVDNNCTAAGWNQAPWTPLLPGVVDLQVAYLFRDGSMHNNTAATLLTTVANVPAQGAPAQAVDATNVLGFRVSVTARSATEVTLQGKIPEVQPALEDHVAGTVQTQFYYFPVSAMAMLRNRVPQR